MTAYKLIYNEEENKVEYVEFQTNNEYDFSHDPETNVDEFVNSHNIHVETAINAADGYNQDIKDGKLKFIKCKDCDTFFILTKEEIYWYKDKDLQLPKRCPKCRAKRKNKSEEGK